MSFDRLPPAQRNREVRSAETRRTGESRAAAAAAKLAAIPAKRPGLERPGERQLRHAGPAFRRALFSIAQTPESAKALVDAMREAAADAS